MAMDLVNIAQGHKATNTPGTNIVFFLGHNIIKNTERKNTYMPVSLWTVDYRPQKPDPYQVRTTVGENLIEYSYDITTLTEDFVTTKILWKSVSSTPPKCKLLCADVKRFYLNTPMEHFEYMPMQIKLIS